MPRRVSHDVEIIEVLNPDDPTIDWSAAYPITPQSRADQFEETAVGERRGSRQRWWVIGGVAAAVAVVAVAVLAVAHRAPSPDLAAGRYVVDDVALRPYAAAALSPPPSTKAFVLWTGTTRDHPFVSVQAESAPFATFIAFDSVLRLSQNARVISPVDDAATSTVVRTFSNGLRIVVRGTGLSDEQFLPLVNSVTVGVDQRGALSIGASPGELRTLGLTAAVADAHTAEQALFGDVTSQMQYLDGHADVVTLRVADGALATHQHLLEFLGRPPVTVVGDRTVGSLASTGENVVMWQQDGRLLTLTAVGDPSQLLAYSHHVRGATQDEWDHGLRYLRPDRRTGDVVTIARGRLWQAALQRGERGGRPTYAWRFSTPADKFSTEAAPLRFDPVVMPFADRIVVEGVTYVFVSVPASSGVTTASVYYGTHDVKELELTRPFADVPMLVAAFRVDDPVPVRVVVPGAVESG